MILENNAEKQIINKFRMSVIVMENNGLFLRSEKVILFIGHSNIAFIFLCLVIPQTAIKGFGVLP
jgi:hypothetical protein